MPERERHERLRRLHGSREPAGAKCGKCGTSQYVCFGTDKTVCETPDDTNACGGCGTLPGTVGGTCGSCGTYQCSGTSMVCMEGTPTVGTVCGICSTSSYVCSTSPGKTVCQTSDDRTVGVDMSYTVASVGFQGIVSPTSPEAVTYVPGRNGNLAAVTLVMLSQQVKGLKIGNLTLAAYVGVPGGKSTLLDTATLTGNAVPAKQSKILFKFPNRPKVTKGTSMYFLIQTTSDIYRYQV